jgi:hypothetical protein
MASGELGHDNLSRALAGLAQALTLDMTADRNTCSHIYRQALIPGILSRLPGHCQLMQTVFDRLPR